MKRMAWTTTAAAFALIVSMAVVEARAAPPMDTGQIPIIAVMDVDNDVNLACDMIVGPQWPDIMIGAQNGNINMNQAHWKDGIGVPWPQQICEVMVLCDIIFIGNWEAASDIWRQGGEPVSAALTRSGAADAPIPISTDLLLIT